MALQMRTAIVGVFLTFIGFILLYYVLCVIGRWKMFNKMGEPGWKALIPFYSDYIIYKRCWNPRMYLVLIAAAAITVFTSGSDGMAGRVADIASLMALIITAVSWYRCSVCFGHGIFFAMGLYFLNPIFTMILGFGSSFYRGNVNGGYFS